MKRLASPILLVVGFALFISGLVMAISLGNQFAKDDAAIDNIEEDTIEPNSSVVSKITNVTEG